MREAHPDFYLLLKEHTIIILSFCLIGQAVDKDFHLKKEAVQSKMTCFVHSHFMWKRDKRCKPQTKKNNTGPLSFLLSAILLHSLVIRAIYFYIY